MPMTKLLEEAFDELSRLPEGDQDAIAKALISLLQNTADDKEWDQLTQDPRSDKALEYLLHIADEDSARGEVFDIDPGKR